jgi:uncharacterized membrane protein YeiH
LSIYTLQMIGTAVFAITGVLALSNKELDAFGGLVLGVVTSLGGGTIRDIIIGVPVFWVQDPNYAWVAVAASIAAFFVVRFFRRAYLLMLYLDGLGAALFAVAATNKVFALQMAPLIAIVMGVLTAIGGGLVRDVLAGRKTLLMSREIYATPILIGCILYVALREVRADFALSSVLAFGLMFLFRACAIRWNLQIPRWMMRGPPAEGSRPN